MYHQLPVKELGPRGDAMAQAVQACVHCGFCLPTCPTYRVLGEEMDSPRGRILLMKQVLEGTLAADEAATHIDRCLGCLACETSCPSGVPYGQLLSPYRAAQPTHKLTASQRARRWLASQTLPYPSRFRLAAKLGIWARSLRLPVPKALAPMLGLLPERLPRSAKVMDRYAATGAPQARVAMLLGCAQQILAPNTLAAAIRILQRHNIEVYVPRSQGCCGALAWHIGDSRVAERFARRNLSAFADDFDFIVTTAAGCGSGLHDYPMILAGTDAESAARALAAKAIDITVLLGRLTLQPPVGFSRTIRAAYHDACHLAHAQRVREQPRELLRKIPGLTLLDIPFGEICCGSAGTYNLDQPDIADRLGQEKVDNILLTQPDVVVLGNIGCDIQIRRHLKSRGKLIPVLHTAELLDFAYRGVSPIDVDSDES